MTNKQLLAFLSSQPEDAEVYVLVEKEGKCPLEKVLVENTIYPWKEIHLLYNVL